MGLGGPHASPERSGTETSQLRDQTKLPGKLPDKCLKYIFSHFLHPSGEPGYCLPRVFALTCSSFCSVIRVNYALLFGADDAL